ncbi:MAG: type II toxin-antitoxin system antitoxin HipB [Oleiphilaceae bacterium]|nr:type II toxin-antitoxin system antitoxin HipB [Oleiphilaceae bacterium]
MKITSPKQLAQAIKNARTDKQLTQQKTAEQIGIKQATVSGFENQPDKARIETLFKLLSALELELHISDRDSEKPTTRWDQEW